MNDMNMKQSVMRMMAQSQLERGQADKRRYLELIRDVAVRELEHDTESASWFDDLAKNLSQAEQQIALAKVQLVLLNSLFA